MAYLEIDNKHIKDAKAIANIINRAHQKEYFIFDDNKIYFEFGDGRGTKKVPKEYILDIAGLLGITSEKKIKKYGVETKLNIFSHKKNNLLSIDFFIKSQLPYELLLLLIRNDSSQETKEFYYQYCHLKYGNKWRNRFLNNKDKSFNIEISEEEAEKIEEKIGNNYFYSKDHVCNSFCKKYRIHKTRETSNEGFKGAKVISVIPRYGLNKLYDLIMDIRNKQKIIKFEEDEFDVNKRNIIVDRISREGTGLGYESRSKFFAAVGNKTSEGIEKYMLDNNIENEDDIEIDYSIDCRNRRIFLKAIDGLKAATTDKKELFPNEPYEEDGKYFLTVEHFKHFIKDDNDYDKIPLFDLTKIMEKGLEKQQGDTWILSQETIDLIKGKKNGD